MSSGWAKYPSQSPEYRRQYLRRYNEKHRERLRAKRAAYYAANKEIIAARARAFYRANSERIKAQTARWRNQNRDRANATRRARYKADHARKLLKGRQYALARRLSGKAAEYRAKTRTKMRKWSRDRSAACSDEYAREQLSKYSPISAKDWPQSLVEAKKLQIKIKRIVREKRNSATQ